MRFWTLHDIAENVPVELDEVIEPVLVTLQSLQQENGFPRLLKIGRNEDDNECYRYVVELELAPGVVLPTECGLLEPFNEGHYDDQDDGETLARDLEEGVLACRGQMHVIEELLHKSRMRVRKVLGRWTGAAQAVRLVQVRLAPYDRWRGGTPEVNLLVDGVDDLLKPEVTQLQINEPGMIEAELEQHRTLFEERLRARSRLARAGAVGTIDELAMNAISHFTDVDETLRLFGSEWRLWLPDDTALIMRDGHVSMGSGAVDPNVEWAGHRVIVRGLYLPRAALDAAVGKPVDEILDHPFLSERMIVTEAVCKIEAGIPRVTLAFDQPRLLFCSDSGKTWDEEVADKAPEASNVTPSLRRVK